MNANTAPAAPVFVRRGRGVKVHVALLVEGKVYGTKCVASPLAGGRMESRLSVVEGPATCLACVPNAAPAAPKAAPAPVADPARIADRSSRIKARLALFEAASAAMREGNRDEALRLNAEAEAIDTSL